MERLRESAQSTLRILLAVCIVLLKASVRSQATKDVPEVAVAAAADLSSALKEIGDGYQEKTGVTVKLSFELNAIPYGN